MSIIKLLTVFLFLGAIGLLTSAFFLYRQEQVLPTWSVTQGKMVYVLHPGDFRWLMNEQQGQITISDNQNQELFVGFNKETPLGFSSWVRVDIADVNEKQLISPTDCQYAVLSVDVGRQTQGFSLGTNFNIECQKDLWETNLVPLL